MAGETNSSSLPSAGDTVEIAVPSHESRWQHGLEVGQQVTVHQVFPDEPPRLVVQVPGIDRLVIRLVMVLADEVRVPSAPVGVEGLPRYGFPNGDEPRPVPCADGYWTPWHLAQQPACPSALVLAWATDDGRVISERQKAAALRDGGASATSVRNYSIPLYAAQQPASDTNTTGGQAQQPVFGEIRLRDSQWASIVNYADCWRGYSKEEAVHEAVKMTEEVMRSNYRSNGFSPNTHPAPTGYAQEKVEALVKAAQAVKDANGSCPGSPVVLAHSAASDDLDWSEEINALLASCDQLDDALAALRAEAGRGDG